jgi:ABC-type phosphate transport system substrate-binding protein
VCSKFRRPMTTGRRRAGTQHPLATLLTAMLLALGVTYAPYSAAAGGVEIITNADHANVPLDRPLLRAIFMMRMRLWPDGAPVRVYVLTDSSEVHDQFCREDLGTYPYVLRGVWDRMVYTGTGLAPVTVNSQQELIEKVRSTPGAIGYYRRAETSQAYSLAYLNFTQRADRP